jgi:hypothetical protein
MTYPTSVPPEVPAEQELSRSPESPDKAGVWEDFIDIFYAPSQVFARRRNGGWGLALFIALVLLIGLVIALKPMLEPYFEGLAAMQTAMMRKSNPQIPEEMLATIQSSTEKWGFIGIPVTMFFFWFLTGCAVWIVGKFFDAKPTFSQSLMISTYANIPRWILGQITAAVIAMVAGAEYLRSSPASISLSPAIFTSMETQPFLFALASRFELFTLWLTVLLGIGLAVVGRIPRSRAFTAAGVIWLLGTLFSVLSMMRQQAATG